AMLLVLRTGDLSIVAALTALYPAGTIVLALRYRRPITLAWSTPGTALIAATGAVEGGWSAEIGAFYVVAGLILLTALIPALGQAIARIPASLA
ncbi:benzoate/H(+) symporter BenE family transporter, partial [Glaesserella parasuis]|uniref:benzoate/H(+) symporter BenE family transporter n=1 Tax=Glaesserella parasuis TaxID=738 RepID=UPI003F31C771